jgi:iron-sulfur cluster assembly protein
MAQPQELSVPEFPLTVSAAAVEQIKRLLAKDGRPDAFLRVGVKGGGCSGFEYVLKLDVKRTPFDLDLEVDGVRVVSDSKSAPYLQGSSLEYTGNLIGGGFKVENPNAAKSCGCGSSFTPKPR